MVNAACHGALLFSGDDPLQKQISVTTQLIGLVGAGKLNPSTGIVTITAGANDAGVSQVLGACAAYGDEVCAGAVASSESGMGQVGEALAYIYGQIHTAAPSAKIAVLSYPRLFEPADGNPYFSAEEQRLINRATGPAVNSTDPRIAYDGGNPLADSNFHPTPTGYRAYATTVMTEVKPGTLAR